MSTLAKQTIIEAVRQTTQDGKPLGVARFEKETGIGPYDWGKYWARSGDLQKEAGFPPNQLQGAYTEKLLIEQIISLIRKLGKFPTYREIQVERNSNTKLPDKKTFQRLGSKQQLATKIIEHCKNKDGYANVVELCTSALDTDEKGMPDHSIPIKELGEVYLAKSGRYYKIGKTNDTVRRGNEIRIQLPERIDLIHSIRTVDPNGIEAYWHRRFESKRMNGEWFDLSAADIKEFRSWRRIS